MGPHFFKCGKCRVHQSAKSSQSASMGPHFFKCGKLEPPRLRGRKNLCFNGAALFQVRKSLNQCFDCSHNRKASMGPHFFKCGKLGHESNHCGQRRRLQWGRTFSSAENTRDRMNTTSNTPRFNGAALFQVRKIPAARIRKYGMRCFNGAALFQVRKIQKDCI